MAPIEVRFRRHVLAFVKAFATADEKIALNLQLTSQSLFSIVSAPLNRMLPSAVLEIAPPLRPCSLSVVRAAFPVKVASPSKTRVPCTGSDKTTVRKSWTCLQCIAFSQGTSRILIPH